MKKLFVFIVFLTVSPAIASTWQDVGTEIEVTEQMAKDALSTKPCDLKTPDGETVVMGEAVVYTIKGDEVRAFQDMYAERYALDYCWQ